MSIKLYIPGSLSATAKGKHLLEVNGKTVGECLNQLVSLLPGMEEVLFYEKGETFALRSRINVLVNGESADAKGLAKEVKDGDEIRIKMNIH